MLRSGDQDPPHGGRRLRLAAAAVAVVLGVGGATTIGYAVGQQQVAPQPVGSALGAQGLERAAPPVPPPSPAAPPATRGPLLGAAPPISISIPTIAVSSPVNVVGLNPDNTMEVPQPGPLYDQAAWYRYSPTPGELGPSVIIGHIDSTDGPSVFFHLGDLQPGQRIEVGRRDGTTAVFEVDAVRSYAKDEFPLLTVYGDTDHAALRLITCGGAFDRARRSYRDNVVVFARLAES